MVKEKEDLRSAIDRKTWPKSGSFQKDSEDVEFIMYHFAFGLNWLHDIIHRDVKASTVLIYRNYKNYIYYIVDFECSIGIVEIGFRRAPEILQATKDNTISENLKIFSKEADVYAYRWFVWDIDRKTSFWRPSKEELWSCLKWDMTRGAILCWWLGTRTFELMLVSQFQR